MGQDSALDLAPLWSTGVTPTLVAGAAASWGERAVPRAGEKRTTLQAPMEVGSKDTWFGEPRKGFGGT